MLWSTSKHILLWARNLLEYFDNSDNISQARAADFLPCNASRLSSNNTIFPYWKATGDDEGVVVDKNTYTAFCPDGYLWRAPSCRSPEKECILYVTSGDGWGMENIMQQISAFSMPLAVGVAEWENYLRLPKAYWMLTYAWSPEDSFLDLRLEQLIFPAHNAYAWSIGDLTSAGDSLRLANIVSYDMGFLAPDLLELLEKSRLDIDTIYDLMRKRKAMQASPREVACQWLKDNEQRWRPWIPDPTACSRGFGLYNELEEDFCQSRANAESCKACLPGTYLQTLPRCSWYYLCLFYLPTRHAAACSRRSGLSTLSSWDSQANRIQGDVCTMSTKPLPR